MSIVHLFVSALLLACGLGAIGGLALKVPQLLGLSIALGIYFTLVALAIGAAVLAALAGAALFGKARAVFRHSWLGLVNGGASLLVEWLMRGSA